MGRRHVVELEQQLVEFVELQQFIELVQQLVIEFVQQLIIKFEQQLLIKLEQLVQLVVEFIQQQLVVQFELVSAAQSDVQRDGSRSVVHGALRHHVDRG